MSDAVEAEKQALRQRLLAARASIGDRPNAAEAACRRLATLPELAAGRIVLGYAANATELSIDTALRRLLRQGTTVCLPWVEGATLGLGVISDLDADLVRGWRGIREPRPPRRVLKPQAVDAVLVPGVGFDPHGNRLGYGGGHFDRLLARMRRGVPLVGVAFDEQVVTQLPVAGHDCPVDVVVTPSRTLRPARL